MPYQTSIKTNKEQNQVDFILESIDQQPACFKYKLFQKILNPIQEDATKLRTCIVKCFYKNCK
jgi:3-methyladenine DNA glycosylase AlkC